MVDPLLPVAEADADQNRQRTVTPYKEAKDQCIDTFTRQYVNTLLHESNGNISQAARMSDLTRAALQKIMRRYNIDGDRFRR